tara:strand:- start:10493 stop:11629 length:1137 start_codon:yes stop_codon:yes gene_type:complete
MESGQRQMVIDTRFRGGRRGYDRISDDLGYSEPELAEVRDRARRQQNIVEPLSERGPYVSPEERTGMVRREDPRRTAMTRRPSPPPPPDVSDELKALAAQASEAQKRNLRMQGQRLKDALAMMEQTYPRSYPVPLAPQAIELRNAAAKIAPFLVAIGDVTLAAELGYNIGQQRSLLGGAMETGADIVEGTGTMMQLPQMAASALPTGYEERAAQGMLTQPELAAEGLAAVGREVSSAMAPYRREQQRESRRDFIDRNTRANMEMNPALTPSEARDSAIQLLRQVEAAPEGGYEGSPLPDADLPLGMSAAMSANQPLGQSLRSDRELQKEEYMNFLVQEGYLKRDDQGRLIQAARTRQEGGYPTMSEFEDDRMLAGGIR